MKLMLEAKKIDFSEAENRLLLIEQHEKNLLSNFYDDAPSFRLGPNDTEPNVRGRVKGMYIKYCEQRDAGLCNGELLEKIAFQIELYRLIDPGFGPRLISSFDHIELAVAELPAAKTSKWVTRWHY